MVWRICKYLKNTEIFWKIFDWKLMYLLGICKYLKNIKVFWKIFDWKLMYLLGLTIPLQIFLKYNWIWWVKFKVVRPCMHFRWKWVNRDRSRCLCLDFFTINRAERSQYKEEKTTCIFLCSPSCSFKLQRQYWWSIQLSFHPCRTGV